MSGIEIISNLSSYVDHPNDGPDCFDEMRVGEVVRALSAHGYTARLGDGAIVLRFDGIDDPDSEHVDRVLEVLKRDIPLFNVDDVIKHDETMWTMNNTVPKISDGGPPYDAATATGMYDP